MATAINVVRSITEDTAIKIFDVIRELSIYHNLEPECPYCDKESSGQEHSPECIGVKAAKIMEQIT